MMDIDQIRIALWIIASVETISLVVQIIKFFRGMK